MRARPLGATTGAAAGLASIAAFLGTAELVALATGPGSTPVVALGHTVITHTPESLKQFAISHFGENDKTALTISIAVVLVLVAALVGALGVRTRRWVAVLAIGALAVITALPAAMQSGASGLQSLPSLLGAGAATAGYLLLTRNRQPVASRETAGLAPTTPPAGVPWLSRRQVLLGSASLLACAAGAYAIGRDGLGKLYSAAASRAAVRLPRPASRTPQVAGTGFDTPGLAPYITPASDFYRVDTALVVPQLSTDSYTLTVHGMAERPAIFSFRDLLDMPLIERPITMVCVSNPVGGPYVGNARWLGVPMAHLLERVGVRPGAEQLFMTSSDGMTIGADLHTATDGRAAMLALAMNGEPLPFEHGFPVRAVIPGIYGYASACKWLVDIELTTYAAKTAYWVQRGYAPKGSVKLESKIDTPAPFAQLRAGAVTVAGSAWHPTVGIRKVEVRVDRGPWQDATLANVESVDTWRLWQWRWQATPGSHSLEVRAIDNHGQVQSATDAAVFPNGASGRDSVVVSVT